MKLLIKFTDTMYYLLLTALLASTFISDGLSASSVVVDTEFGQVRGYQQFTIFENKTFYSFRGIPYAKPPSGELRFKVKL